MEKNNFSIFPWDKGEKPYFVNDEGFEWYVDKGMTKWARDDRAGSDGLKGVVCFYVKKKDHVTRILINDKQEILKESQGLEDMAAFIDILRVQQMYDKD